MKKEKKSNKELMEDVLKSASTGKMVLILVVLLCIYFGMIIGLCVNSRAMDSQQELELVQQLAQQNAEQHNWIYGKFMCVNFVGQLSIKLYDNRIKMNLKSGKWFQNGDGTCSEFNRRHFRCKHTWLSVILENKTEINLEATTGRIIPEDIYKRNYK